VVRTRAATSESSSSPGAARVNDLQALTELYRAEGTLLERRRIVVAGTR
jgi:hypothetical protein